MNAIDLIKALRPGSAKKLTVWSSARREHALSELSANQCPDPSFLGTLDGVLRDGGSMVVRELLSLDTHDKFGRPRIEVGQRCRVRILVFAGDGRVRELSAGEVEAKCGRHSAEVYGPERELSHA